jgi:hypothetical protein
MKLRLRWEENEKAGLKTSPAFCVNPPKSGREFLSYLETVEILAGDDK